MDTRYHHDLGGQSSHYWTSLKHVAELRQNPGFFVYDKDKKEILTLTLTKIHKERLSNIGEGTYFACADFSASNGNIYDLDIFMTGKSQSNLVVTEINVHKENGTARYLWKNQQGIWVKTNK